MQTCRPLLPVYRVPVLLNQFAPENCDSLWGTLLLPQRDRVTSWKVSSPNKTISALAGKGTLVLGPTAVLTPLARDRARKLGLKIERRR